MQFELTPESVFYAASLMCAVYVIGACLCRIRHASGQIKHAWKLIYVLMLGLAGWALCDLLSAEHSLFQQTVTVAVALYIHMTKTAWLNGPPAIAKTAAPVPEHTYAQYRPFIKTGDMIGIATGTLGGRIIQLGQIIAGLPYSHITHSAIAVWVGERLMVVEMNAGGNVYKPLSQYAGKRMVVCAPPAGADLSQFDLGLDHITEHHIPYSALDLVRIGARLLPMRVIDTRGWGGDGDSDKVCSLLPAVVYRALGGDVSAIPALAAPAEVAQSLSARFSIEGA